VVQDWGGPIGLRLAVERRTSFAARDPEHRHRRGAGLRVAPLSVRSYERYGSRAGPADPTPPWPLDDEVVEAYNARFRSGVGAGVLAFPELVPTESTILRHESSRCAPNSSAGTPALVSSPTRTDLLARRGSAPGSPHPRGGPGRDHSAGHFLQEEKGERSPADRAFGREVGKCVRRYGVKATRCLRSGADRRDRPHLTFSRRLGARS
jgi:hypothetical protein